MFVHDAIDYMTTEEDLRRALTTAFVHLAPGGTAVVVPDATRETFESDHGAGGSDGDDGRSVRFLEWTTDPDPNGTEAVTEYAFLLRHADGAVQVVHETHRTGLFPRATWFGVFAEIGVECSGSRRRRTRTVPAATCSLRTNPRPGRDGWPEDPTA